MNIKRARPAMGTLLHVSASGEGRDGIQQAVESALDAVACVERLMSFHDESSELSRLNRHAHEAPQRVHRWTYAVLRRALRVSEASNGLFDFTVAPLLMQSGHLPAREHGARSHGGWRYVRLLPDLEVAFDVPLMLDLGGIAKGFAVDVALHCLRQGGCTEGRVNAGGDLRRFGRHAEVIYLRRASGLLPAAQMRCGAVATSAVPEAHEDRLEQPLGCIMDPRIGQPWRDGAAVMVAASTCVMADALTKVAALAGPACEPLLARFGAQAQWYAH